jgi:hypothetical protein
MTQAGRDRLVTLTMLDFDEPARVGAAHVERTMKLQYVILKASRVRTGQITREFDRTHHILRHINRHPIDLVRQIR